jgi:hypothetical protein
VISRANSAALGRAGGGASRRRRKTSPRWISWEPSEVATLKMCGAPGLVECRARRCAGGVHFRGLGVLVGTSRLRLQLPTLSRRSRDPSHTLGAAPTSCRSYALDNNSTVTLYKRASLFPAVVERLPMPSACSLHARPLQPGAALDNLPPACVLQLGGAK